MTVQASIARW